MNQTTPTVERELVPVSGFVKNQKSLAEVLGISRQLVAYHCKLPGSPGRRDDGRYEIAAWREYLASNSRVKLAQRRQGFRLTFGDGMEAAFAILSDRLPSCFQSALRVAGIS